MVSDRFILGTRIDATSYAAATEQVLAWAGEGRSRCVCVANVHMVMECYDAPDYRKLVNGADMVTPDGMPLVWALKRLGVPGASRVYGPTLTLHVCEVAARSGVPVGFYGGTAEVLADLVPRLKERFEGLEVEYAYSPPFRPLNAEEDAAVVKEIRASGVRILFVGLGCPRQERWMAEHLEALDVVMLGVGAAFDFHAGRVRQAPAWLQDRGLEWAFRFAVEPRRLWRRYVKHNPRFAVLFALQWAGLKSFSPGRQAEVAR